MGQTAAQMPQPLQYTRSMSGPTLRETHTSGQYTQQSWQVILPAFTARQASGATSTGRCERQPPVLPASPTLGVAMQI